MDKKFCLTCPKCKIRTVLLDYAEFSIKRAKPNIQLKCECTNYPIVLFSLISNHWNDCTPMYNSKDNNYIQNQYEELLCDICNNYDSIINCMKSEQNKKEMISVLTNYHSWLKLCFVEISAIISKVFYDYQISNKDKDTIQFMNYNAITLKDLNNIKDCYIKLNQEINNEAIDKEHIKLLLKKQLMNYSHIVIVNQHNKPINLKAEKYFYSFPSLQFLMKYKPRYSFNKPVCYTRSHKDSIECVCEVTNNRMATSCYDQTIKLWKRNDKVPYHSFLGHTGSVLTIIQLKNGLLVSGSCDKKIMVWDIDRLKCIKTLTEHIGGIVKLFELSNGPMISGSIDATLRVWNTSNWKSYPLLGHEQTIESITEVRLNIIASCSLDRTCRVWDIQSKQCLHTYHLEPALLSMDRYKDNEILIVGDNMTIYIIDADTGEVIREKKCGVPVFSISHLHNKIIAGFGDCTAKVFRYPELEEEMVLAGLTNTVICVTTFSNDEICCSDWNGDVIVWKNI